MSRARNPWVSTSAPNINAAVRRLAGHISRPVSSTDAFARHARF